MPNFYIALSGLQADSKSLNTIASNLSNMNTTAYKSVTTNFSDMFYESLGSTTSGNPIQVGTGTKVASTTTNYTQGDYNTNGMSTSDMAIDGDGFFVVGDGSQNYLTRNGSFTESTSGNLMTSSGHALLGYPATNGVISSTTLSKITLPTKGSVISPTASSEMTIVQNLNSSSAVGDSTTSTTKLFDSLGQTHTATITYTKTGSNTWDYSISLPDADFTSGTGTAVTGTLNFDASGNLSTLTTGGTTTNVGTASGDVSTVSAGFTGLADSANPLSLSWNLLNSSGKQIITQVQSDSKTSSSLADGFAAGTYSSFTVESDGTVEAYYSNGETQSVGKVALADVTNEQGLSALGNNLYQTTTASGDMNIGSPSSGSLGSIRDSALEESNVDISTEFSQLIIAQRAFEANSKTITTFDTVTEETINIIR